MSQKRWGKKSFKRVVLGPSGANLRLSRPGPARLVSARFGLARLGPARLSLVRRWPGAARTGSARLGLDRVGPAWLDTVCFFCFYFFPLMFRTVVGRGKIGVFIVKTNVLGKKSGRWLGGEKISDSGIVWGCLGHLGAALLGSARLGPGPV